MLKFFNPKSALSKLIVTFKSSIKSVAEVNEVSTLVILLFTLISSKEEFSEIPDFVGNLGSKI